MDLEMYRGDTHTVAVEFEDSDGDAIPVTGWAAWMTVRNSDQQAVVEKFTASVPEGNVVEFVLEPGDTEGINPGRYLYDIQVKTTQNEVKTFAGRITILKDITLTSEVPE
jgi:hypothetical protein